MSHSTHRSRSNDGQQPPTMAHLTELLRGLNETTTELKTDVLALTRKIVSLEAEIDYLQGKRQLR